MSGDKIICIIVTYNGAKWIATALQSLRNSSIPVQPVIVDNASTDATVDIIKAVWPEAHLIESGENLGFGKANNLGLRYALEQHADYVFLMNQDVYVEKRTFELLLEASKLNPDFSIISPVHQNGVGTLLDYNFSVHTTPPEAPVELISSLLFQNYKEKVFPVRFVNAAAWFLPISTIQSFGGFDPLFSHYGEDEHYLQRLSYHGAKVGISLATHIRHDREVFGNVAEYRKGLCFRQLLMGAMDITRGGWSCCSWFVKQSIKFCCNLFSFVLKVNIRKTSDLITSYIKFLLFIPKILKSRKTNQMKGPHWI
jgi:GT2 family glycosyltransferase